MTRLVCFLFLVLIQEISFSQASPCAATTSFCNTTVQSVTDTWTAAGSGIVNPTCASGGIGAFSDQFWIVYTAPATATSVQLDFASTTGGGSRPLTDPSFQFYSNTGGCGGTFTLVGCFNNDLGGGADESETIAVTGGNTYYIRVFNGGSPRNVSYSGGTRTYEFTACITSLIPGDEPCSAIPITTFPYSNTASTIPMSNSSTGGCEGNFLGTLGDANDYFYSLTVAANSHYSIQLTGTDPTMVLDVGVLSAASCSGPFTCVANGAWAGGLQTTTGAGTGSPGADSPCRSVFFATAGTYYLKIDADAGDNSVFTLTVDQYTPGSGDNCANATGLSSGIAASTNNTNCNTTVGTDDPAGALFCAGSIENTSWLVFQSDGGGSDVSVLVDGVACDLGYAVNAGPPIGATYYSASGQFGIFTSSTDACGGAYTSAEACQSLATGATYTTTLPNATPTTYFLVWDGNGGAECDFSLTVTNVIALPAELVSFRGRKEMDSNELLWEVASESNLSHYVLESSSNGLDFNAISFVAASGNSTENLFYTFSDLEYHLPTSFYRLKMVDYDGVEKYSNIVAMDRTSEIENLEVSIFPNPSDGVYTFQAYLNSSENVTYSILTSLGQVVYSEEYDLQKGENSMKVDLTSLADGVYFVEVVTNAVKKTIQLVKQ